MLIQPIDHRRPVRQDTFDLRDQRQHVDDPSRIQAHADGVHYASTDDEEHSVLEDDSDQEDRDLDYMDDDDDGSSSLSIPNESIDFDLVYSLRSFAATVEGQANVVKGDSLFLMDDSNSYWWLVRVLKTQEVGYIPAENIETPFERLARLNKHRNVDLASATQAELEEDVHASRERLRNQTGLNPSPSPIPRGNGARSGTPNQSTSSKGVSFIPTLSIHRYPPAVWNDEDEDDEDAEWDDEAYEDEDTALVEDQINQQQTGDDGPIMEPDDGMGWDDSVAEEMQVQVRQTALHAPQPQQAGPPGTVRFGPPAEQLQPQLQQQQQQRFVHSQQPQQIQQPTPQQLGPQQPLQPPVLQIQPAQMQDQAPILRPQVSVDLTRTPPASITRIDPLEVTETRKLTVTPTIARDVDIRMDTEPSSVGPLLPSALIRQQDEDRKRTREEIEALEESVRKKAKGKMPAPISSADLTNSKAPLAGGNKLRKEQPDEDSSIKEKEKKKKGGMFGGLFGRRKDKSKDKDKDKETPSIASTESTMDTGRGSEESTRSTGRPSVSAVDGLASPTTVLAIQQQQQQQQQRDMLGIAQQTQPQQLPQPQQAPQQHLTVPSAHVSQHASQLRQRDQHQQALYQQYLNSSPSSPPEAQANYGLQTAAVMAGSNSYGSTISSSSGLAPGPRPRPGSLILSPTTIDGQGVGVPELSVIRVFAGQNVQTEATFKTVLLNSSTTSHDLVKQAMQRFRLPAGEDESDYYLTVKQIEGSSAVLLPTENPLRVFETLVEAAMELPKVKRSSVGSISSLASNLSMHPAITKLSMNDFTDDSAVKFYLNRKGAEGIDDGPFGQDGDSTIMADLSFGEAGGQGFNQYLSVSTSSNGVTPERFSSPSFRFALQLVIYPEDLPDDMVFDSMTEAIVFKHTLRDRSSVATSSSFGGVSQHMRKKVFVFPKNVTVAEVIELGLERFGIVEGVVDGGDEVEDKLTKRRSSTRLRYGLNVNIGSQERELAPPSKVIDAYPKPPAYRAVDRAMTDRKRRSVDSTQLLSNSESIDPSDPIFILRRALSHRNPGTRHRVFAPLDELALRHHRESASSMNSDTANQNSQAEEGAGQVRQHPTKQEIIAAQRAATRATQKAILSAQTNSLRGVDVLLSGNAVLRSSRYEIDDLVRYSYVLPDGETYDISDIIEEEWGEGGVQKNDRLEDVLSKKDGGVDAKVDRVLNRVKGGKGNGHAQSSSSSVAHSNSMSTMGSNVDSIQTSSMSDYSLDEPPSEREMHSRSSTPVTSRRSPTPTDTTVGRIQRTMSPLGQFQSTNPEQPKVRPRATTPSKMPLGRQPSIASVMSDLDGYATPPQATSTPDESPREMATPKPSPPKQAQVQGERKKLIIPQEDFGISHMMAVIEYGGSIPKVVPPALHPVDEFLYGRKFHVGSLHPEIREIYADSFKKLEEIDKALDEFVQNTIGYDIGEE